MLSILLLCAGPFCVLFGIFAIVSWGEIGDGLIVVLIGVLGILLDVVAVMRARKNEAKKSVMKAKIKIASFLFGCVFVIFCIVWGIPTAIEYSGKPKLNEGSFSGHSCEAYIGLSLNKCGKEAIYEVTFPHVISNYYYCSEHHNEAVKQYNSNLQTWEDVHSGSSSNSVSSYKCAICGKTDGLRQITAQTSDGRSDNYWYCIEHYADAWQYYYGNN